MNLATAFVEIRVDAAGAKADAKKAISDINAGAKASIELSADDTKARQTVDKVAKDIDGTTGEIAVGVNDQTVAPVRSIDERLAKLDGEDRTVLLRAEVKAAESEVTRLERKLQDPALDDQEIRLVIDQRNEAAKKIDAIKKDLGDLPEEARKSADGVTKQIAQLFGAAAFSKGIKESIDAASNLQQAIGATETVFGSAKNAIDDFADSAAEGFGISERAARELTAGIGALLQNFGLTANEAATTSVSLAKLGADLAAAFGGNPEEAVQALGAALRGENDPVERFGISLSAVRVEAKALELGLISAGGEMTSNAKIQATLALITEQTANVQGQAAREADTAAGAQARATAKAEDAAASLGTNFLPIYSKVVEVVGALADGFGALPGPIQTSIVALVGLVAFAGPINKVVDLSKTLISSFTKVGEDGSKSLTKLGKAATGLSTALGAAAAALAIYELAQLSAKQDAEDFTGIVGNLARVTDEELVKGLKLVVGQWREAKDMAPEEIARKIATENLGAAIRVRDLAVANEDLRSSLEGQGITVDVLTTAIDAQAAAQAKAGAAAEEAQAAIDAAAAAQENVGTAAAAAVNPMSDLTKAYHGQGEAARLGDDAEQAYADGIEAAADAHEDAVDRIIDSLGDQISQFEALSNAASNLKSAIDAVIGGDVNMEEADRAVRAAKDSLTKTLKDNGVTLDSNTEKGRANREQIQASARSILDYGVAAIGAGASTEQAAASVQFMTDQLRGQLEQAGFTKDQIDAYLDTVGLTPEKVLTSIDLAGDEAAKETLKGMQDQLNGLDEGATAEVQALIEQGKYQEALRLLEELTKDRTTTVTTIAVAGKVGGKGYASGTTNATRGVHPIAERGRELVDYGGGRLALFSGGETVYNNPDTEKILAAGGPGGTNLSATVNNYGSPVTVDDVARALAIARMQ